MLVLGLGEIGKEILEILVYLSLAVFKVNILFLLNCKDTHCWKDLSLSLVISLFYPDL